MSGYEAIARIERVEPRFVLGALGAIGEAGADRLPSQQVDDAAFEFAPVVDDDPFFAHLVAIRDRWDQLTFYLFDAEGWR